MKSFKASLILVLVVDVVLTELAKGFVKPCLQSLKLLLRFLAMHPKVVPCDEAVVVVKV